jgi:hypothetical protein
MTTPLQILRTIFPEATRTPDQDMLIGSSCLALTATQRESICTYGDLTRAFTIYRAANNDVAERIATVKLRAEIGCGIVGGITGAAAGATVGAYIGNRISPAAVVPCAIFCGVSGGVAGGYAAADKGGLVAANREIATLTHSREARQWTHNRLKMDIYPPLMQYLTTARANEVQQRDLICPLSLDWMDEPVLAGDLHTYERTKILDHLDAWDRRYPAERLAAFSQEQRDAAYLLRSPFRICNIKIAEFKPAEAYHQTLFPFLINNYNESVILQREIVATAHEDAANPVKPARLDQRLHNIGMNRFQADKVVRFYDTPKADLQKIAKKMAKVVLDTDELAPETPFTMLEQSAVITWLNSTTEDRTPLLA